MHMTMSSPERIARYGPWAVVTGASDGIGHAVAREAASGGLNIVLVARRQDRLQSLADELHRAFGVATRVMALDLGEHGTPSRLLAETADLDIGLLAACAGYGTSGAFLDIPVADEIDMLDVNCRAVVELTHGYGRRFAAQGRGGIVLMSSIVGLQGVPRSANYAATKGYIQSLAEGIRPDLAAAGVDVLCVQPGPVASGFAARAGMDLGKAADPSVVARDIMAALGRRFTVRPGLQSKLLIGSLSTLPRSLRVMAMTAIMKGMTKGSGTTGAAASRVRHDASR
jgi:uncharacterized protein